MMKRPVLRRRPCKKKRRSILITASNSANTRDLSLHRDVVETYIDLLENARGAFVFHHTTNSVRRFFARPSAVPFVATGLLSPKPLNRSRAVSIPLPIR